jgi:hypothetical protein
MTIADSSDKPDRTVYARAIRAQTRLEFALHAITAAKEEIRSVTYDEHDAYTTMFALETSTRVALSKLAIVIRRIP